jgi:hypothetical protein
MKEVEYWYWRMRSETAPNKVVTTRWRMPEAEALARDPDAERVPGTLEVRELPETDEEKAGRHYGMHRKPDLLGRTDDARRLSSERCEKAEQRN